MIPQEREGRMSVLIKGMKMPGSCTMCWLSPICPVWVKEVSRHKGYDDRLPGCPLIEASTLMRRVEELCASRSCWDCSFCYSKSKSTLGCKLRDIFESEEG